MWRQKWKSSLYIVIDIMQDVYTQKKTTLIKILIYIRKQRLLL